MTPAAWPMDPEEIEARRREAEILLGRPYPKVPREELNKGGIYDLLAGMEWSRLDAMRNGVASHVKHLT
jgi:hypothetical protein